MTGFGLVLNGLGRKKLRTTLLVFATFIAFLIFGVIGAFNAAFNADTGAEDRLTIVNKVNFTQPLPLSYVNRVSAVEGVEDVSYYMWFGGYFQEQRNFLFAFAVDAESWFRVYDEWMIPEDQLETFISDRDSIVVGKDVAEQYGWEVGQQIPLSTNIWTRADGTSVYPVTIAGIYDTPEGSGQPNGVYLQYEYLNEGRGFARDTIGTIVVKVADPARNEELINEIDLMFANSRAETETITESAFNRQFAEQLGNISLIVVGVTSAAFLTILMIVGNAMAGAIRERTREIATMKTIGFKSGRIARMVLGETMLMAFLGGLLGLGASAVLATGVTEVTGGAFGNLRVTPMILVQGLGFMAALGLITGLIPAITATRVNVVTALGKG